MTISVGIYLFDEVEVLDFSGPFEVFSTASRVHSKRGRRDASPFNVHLIADAVRPVRARGGLLVSPPFSIANHPKLDVLLIPGGDVTRELARSEVIQWIEWTYPTVQLTAAICTGAFLLAKARLLNDRRATTHWEDLDDLRASFPRVTVIDDVRWVEDGRLITSAGISAGIDMCLHLVEKLVDPELAVATAKQMDYPWIGKLSPTPGFTFENV
jgi:transcriptional regulator GlxA family with amidase domain